jgi:imidazole glycerol-phosphate synthase subunit HisF
VLKRRLIPCLFLQNGLIVRSQEFCQFKQLGNPLNQLERLNDWNADELIYVDITREGDYDLKRDDLRVPSRKDVLSILRDISMKCFMPLSFGGRIRSLETVDQFIAGGADKVVINTGAYLEPELITQVAQKYGSQAMVVAVDVKKESDGYAFYIHNGRKKAEKPVMDWIKEAQDRGAGEIFLNSIDRDGTANGYDLEIIQKVCDSVSIPVIACGGAGTFEDFTEVLEKTSVSAIAAGNIFNFTENAYLRAKKMLREQGMNVR